MKDFRRAAFAILAAMLLAGNAIVPVRAMEMTDEEWAAVEAAAEQEILAIEAAVAAAQAAAVRTAEIPAAPAEMTSAAPTLTAAAPAAVPAAPAESLPAIPTPETPAAPAPAAQTPLPAETAPAPAAEQPAPAVLAAVQIPAVQAAVNSAAAITIGTLADSAAKTAANIWTGTKLTKLRGVNMGPSGKETYYNLDMTRVVEKMRALGYAGEYWVRDDGCKMFGNYIMCAGNYAVYPLGSLVESSLGTCIICDTGGFAVANPTMLDIAVTW